jgi:phospho-N-acetylmuramoyl-pentapeptide-transferase
LIALVIDVVVAILVTLFVTPFFVKFLTNRQMGQFIRQDGPQSHLVKRGTPTMGGLIIILASLMGYASAALYMFFAQGRTPKVSSLLALGLMVTMGAIGFIDDFAKIRHKQSEGLTVRSKLILQTIFGMIFAVLCLLFPNAQGVTPAQAGISFENDIFSFNFAGKIIGTILFIIWVNFIVAAWTNAVNLTDGLDGLATGVSLFSWVSYVFICIWQFSHSCHIFENAEGMCYITRDPWDLSLVAGAILGACFGFLWHNASPAKIFMGDTGSLALGGAFAAISILTHTQLLAIIIGGVFVAESVSVVAQVSYYKLTKKRLFKMAPLHHHFELLNWKEVNVVIRFWLIAGICMVLGLGIFYSGWISFQ